MSHGGKGATVRGTYEDGTGVLRLDFPGGAGEDQLEHIWWDEWFEKYERERLAFPCQEQ